MTVFVDPPEVVASSGTPVVPWTAADARPTEPAVRGVTYQAEYNIKSQPREMYPKEAAAFVGGFVKRFAVEHPESRIVYTAIVRGSPQKLVVQFQPVGTPPLLAAILAAIAAVAAIVKALIVPVLMISFLFVAVRTMLRISDFLVPGPVERYRCPYCGREFETYGELKTHIETEHPGKPVPTMEETKVVRREWWLSSLAKMAGIAVIGLAGAYVFFRFVLPAMRRK